MYACMYLYIYICMYRACSPGLHDQAFGLFLETLNILKISFLVFKNASMPLTPSDRYS